MAAAISNEIRRRVAQFSSTSTLLTLTLVNHNFYASAEIFLYQYISLGFPQALLFFRSLHARPVLGSYVRSLHLYPSRSRHEGTIFRSALGSMSNLQFLYIMGPVDFECILSSLHATLGSFRYGLPVDGFVRQFLAQQPTLFAISLYHPLGLEGRVPRNYLPNLRKVEAHEEDVYPLIDGASVHSIKFRYHDPGANEQSIARPIFFVHCVVPITEFDCLACQLLDFGRLDELLPALQALIVRPDIMWGVDEPTPEYPQLVTSLVRKLRRLADLRLFVVATTYRTREAEPIKLALNRYITHFSHFVFHTHNRCISWDDIHASPPVSIINTLHNCPAHCLPDRLS